jgi:multicomponent Na+:H+ antiporter subunit F
VGVCRHQTIWQKMLAFSSIATKTAILILVVSVIRDDWMIGVAAVIMLSVGNASLMLLAHLIHGLGDLSKEPWDP